MAPLTGREGPDRIEAGRFHESAPANARRSNRNSLLNQAIDTRPAGTRDNRIYMKPAPGCLPSHPRLLHWEMTVPTETGEYFSPRYERRSMSRYAFHLAALLPLLAVPGMLPADESQEAAMIPLLVTWRGSVANEKLLGDPPAAIGGPEEWKSLWETWKLPGDVPEVDFGECLVLVQATRGGRLRMSAKVDGKGDLSILAVATRDLRPGFRYALGVVRREGLVTVGGQPVPTASAE